MRHRVLLMGAPGSGKSRAIIDAATMLPDSRVIVFDRQDGIRPILQQLGETPPNLELHLVEGEAADAWPTLRAAAKAAREKAKAGDWVCFDVASDFWALSQEAYIAMRYGVDLADYLLEEASKTAKGKKALSFGGLAPDDWSIIKAQYYTVLPQTLGAGCLANVLVTAQMKAVASWIKDGELRYLEPDLPAQYKKAGIKPFGESGLTGQVDVVLQAEHPTEKKWRMRTLGKNRLGLEFEWADFSDKAWLSVYLERLGLEAP